MTIESGMDRLRACQLGVAVERYRNWRSGQSVPEVERAMLKETSPNLNMEADFGDLLRALHDKQVEQE